MKMYEDYDFYRDHKHFEEEANALIPFFLSSCSDYAETDGRDPGYLQDFDGVYSSAGVDSTAASKPLIFKTDPDEDAEGWKNKDPKIWTNIDVLYWIASVAEYQKIPYEMVNASAFNVDGKTLLSLSLRDFLALDEKCGPALYAAFHKSLSEYNTHSLNHPQRQTECKLEVKLETLSTPSRTPDVLLQPLAKDAAPGYGLVSAPEAFHNDITNSSESYPFELDPVPCSSSGSGGCVSNSSSSNASTATSVSGSSSSCVLNMNEAGGCGESSGGSERDASEGNAQGCSDSEQSDMDGKRKGRKSGKRPPGRPPGVKSVKDKSEKKTGRLWEFIRDLLLDPEHCPSEICWENHEDGVFRFVKSEKVAKIWGDRKGNEKMNYEKLSRAMRYYYRSKVLQPVIGRRLVYKFGPTARGWKTENPNFRH